MAVTVLAQVNIDKAEGGVYVLGPYTLPDDAREFELNMPPWTGSALLSAFIDMSFDGGRTWATYWTGSNRLGLSVRVDGLWALCQCGELYVPGHAANGTTVVHSAYRGWTSEQIAAIFPGQWLHEADPDAFHNPDSWPALQLRQLRVTCFASAPVRTSFTVRAA